MRALALILPLLLLLAIASAGIIEVEVKMKLSGRINLFLIERMNNIVKVTTEFYNTGSVPYKARARFDVLNSSELIFSAWSEEKALMPGERKTYEMYWYAPSKAKNLTARLRVYFGNEILEKSENLSIEYVKSAKDIFQIKNFRTYDDYLRFEIRANESLENVIVAPSDYMHGWIFEQAKLEKLQANRNTEIRIKYIPTVWRESEVKINVFTEDGKYYSSKTFELKKEKGLSKFLHMIYDKLSLIFNF